MRHLRLYRSRYILLILFILIFLCYVYDGFHTFFLPGNQKIFFLTNYERISQPESLIYTLKLTINSSLLVTCLVSYCITNIFSKSYNVQHLFLWVVLLIHYTCLTILDVARDDQLKFGVCLRGVNVLVIYLCTALGLQTLVSVVCMTLAIEFIFFALNKPSLINFIFEIFIINLFHLIGILMYCQMYFRTIDTLHCEVFSLSRFLDFMDFQIITQKLDLTSYPKKHKILCINHLIHIPLLIRNNCIKFIVKLKGLWKNDIKRGLLIKTYKILGINSVFRNKKNSERVSSQVILQYFQSYFSWYNFLWKIKTFFFYEKVQNIKRNLNLVFCTTSDSNPLDEKYKECFDSSQKNKNNTIDNTKNSFSVISMNTSDTATWSSFPNPRCDFKKQAFRFLLSHVFRTQDSNETKEDHKCNFSNSLYSIQRGLMSHYTSDDSSIDLTVESKPINIFNNLSLYMQIFVFSCKKFLNIHDKQLHEEKKHIFLTTYPRYYQCLKSIQRNYIIKEVIGFRLVGLLGTPTSNWIWKRMITSELYNDKNIRINDSSLCYGLYGNLPFQFSLLSPERTSSFSTTSCSYNESDTLPNKQKSYCSIHVDQQGESNNFCNIKNLFESFKKNNQSIYEKSALKRSTELNEIVVDNQEKFFDETETIFCDNCKYHDLNDVLKLYEKITHQRKKVFTEGNTLQYEFYNTSEKEKQEEKEDEEEEDGLCTKDDPLFQCNGIVEPSFIPTMYYRTDGPGYRTELPHKRLQLLESVCVTPSRNKTYKLRQHAKQSCRRKQRRLLKDTSTSANANVIQFGTNVFSSPELKSCERGCKNLYYQDFSFDDIGSSFTEKELLNFDIVHTALKKSTNISTKLKSFFTRRIRQLSNEFSEYMWTIADAFGLDQVVHMVLCCNFVLEAGSWHNKVIIPENTILYYSLANCNHQNEYGQWVTLINIKLRYIRGCVQLLGTIMNLLLIAMILYSSTITHCFESLTPYIIQFPFYRGFVRATNISQNSCSRSSMKFVFFFCYFFVIFSLLEVILIVSQILVWKLYSWNITHYVAEILDFERFSISLICLCHHATHKNADFEVYTLMLLNIALSAIFHPFSSMRFGVVLGIKILVVNVVYILSVAHSWSGGSWERQWFRLNILLAHESLIIFILFVRADEECLRRTFSVFIFPYLFQLSYLIGQSKQLKDNENGEQENEQLSKLKGVRKPFSISHSIKTRYRNQSYLGKDDSFCFPELQSFYKNTKI